MLLDPEVRQRYVDILMDSEKNCFREETQLAQDMKAFFESLNNQKLHNLYVYMVLGPTYERTRKKEVIVAVPKNKLRNEEFKRTRIRNRKVVLS